MKPGPGKPTPDNARPFFCLKAEHLRGRDDHIIYAQKISRQTLRPRPPPGSIQWSSIGTIFEIPRGYGLGFVIDCFQLSGHLWG